MVVVAVAVAVAVAVTLTVAAVVVAVVWCNDFDIKLTHLSWLASTKKTNKIMGVVITLLAASC